IDLDLVAELRQHAGVAELLDGDGSFALVADVHQHLAVADPDHRAPDALAPRPADARPFFDVAHAAIEPILHAFLGGVSHLLLGPSEDLRLPVVRLHNPVLPPLIDVAGA